MWLEQHSQPGVSVKAVPWEMHPPPTSEYGVLHSLPQRLWNQLCFDSRALHLLDHSWSLLVNMWLSGLAAQYHPVLLSLVLNCWCASHWLSVFEMMIKTKLKIPWSSHAASCCFHLLPLIVTGLGRLPFPAPGSGPVHNSTWHVAHQIARLAFCRPQCGLEKVKVSGWK